MFDWLTIARRLTEADMTRELVDATADAIREAAEHGDHVTPETLRAELSGLESRLSGPCSFRRAPSWAALVGIAGIVIGVLRLFG